MAELQAEVGAAEYADSSPHLVHLDLRARLVAQIRELVLDRLDATGRCRVLEVGAGEGAFTDHILAAGAEVVVTEMSKPSFALLRARLRHNSQATTVYDPDGEEIFRGSERFDLVFCISVLHHVPDYLGLLARLVDRIEPGGSLVSYQDPLFYPRRSGASLRAERTAYLAWRIWRGDLRRGLATQLRRRRGLYDENLPGDMVEYHVVRQGLDEITMMKLLRPRFEAVSLLRYWSTQSRLLQTVGSRVMAPNTFGLLASGRVGLAPAPSVPPAAS
jgi:SAM-dependent methyltransferase